MAAKTILITGAAGHVGSAVVERLLKDKHQVIATTEPGKSDQVERLQKIAPQGADLHIEPLDVMDATAVAEFLKQDMIQQLDAAILLVGGFGMGDLENTSAEAIDKMINLNFKSAFHLSKGLFPHLEKRGGGRMVFMGARPALDPEAGSQMMAYSLSKGLLIQFVEQLNALGADKGIVCSLMVPSVVNTGPNREAMPDANFDDWVQPAEIAHTIAFAIGEKGAALRKPVFKLYADS